MNSSNNLYIEGLKAKLNFEILCAMKNGFPMLAYLLGMALAEAIDVEIQKR